MQSTPPSSTNTARNEGARSRQRASRTSITVPGTFMPLRRSVATVYAKTRTDRVDPITPPPSARTPASARPVPRPGTPAASPTGELLSAQLRPHPPPARSTPSENPQPAPSGRSAATAPASTPPNRADEQCPPTARLAPGTPARTTRSSRAAHQGNATSCFDPTAAPRPPRRPTGRTGHSALTCSPLETAESTGTQQDGLRRGVTVDLGRQRRWIPLSQRWLLALGRRGG